MENMSDEEGFGHFMGQKQVWVKLAADFSDGQRCQQPCLAGQHDVSRAFYD